MLFNKLWLALSALILGSGPQLETIKLNLKDLVTQLKIAQNPDERAAILRDILEQLRLPGSKAEAAAIIRGNGDIRIPLLEQLRPKTFTDFIAESTAVTDGCKDCARALNELDIDLNIEPTESLMLRATSKQKPEIQKYFTLYPKALPVFEAALSHEKKLKQDRSLTLYHACKKEIYAMAYLDTKLMELAHGNRPHYLKLRQPFGSYTPTQDPAQIRIHFLNHGTPDNNHSYERYHLLSANHALMGNLLNSTSSTAYLFAKNNNRSCPAFDVEKIFEQSNLTKYYEQYKAELTQVLDIDMEGGVLLQLAFSPDLIDKTVYPAHAGGPKRKIRIQNNDEEKPSLILDALTKNPFSIKASGRLQWRVILTHDMLLNPNSPEVLRGDFKVFTHSMEPETLAAFHARIDAIVAQIKQDVLNEGIH